MCYNAPDPTPAGQVGAAQVSQNIGTAIANSFMNNVNQVGPDGTKTNTVSDYYTYTDKTDPKNPVEYKIPIWNQMTTLSPDQQKLYDQTNATKLGLSQLAGQQTGFLKDYMGKPWDPGLEQVNYQSYGDQAGPFKYDVGEHEKWASGLYDKLNSGREQQQMSGLQTQLANSGIKLGSDAYDRAMQSQSKSIEDARNQFELNSYQQGFGNDLSAYQTNANIHNSDFGNAMDAYKTAFSSSQALRNQPLNEISALMSGSQVSMPNFGPTNSYTIPTVDQAGNIHAQDQQLQQNAMNEYNARSGILGGLFSLGSSFLSDKRAKTDIEKTGEMQVAGDDGKEHETGLYAYRYKGEPKSKPKHKGVMAQNILKIKPSAVSKRDDGLFAVNYSKLQRA